MRSPAGFLTGSAGEAYKHESPTGNPGSSDQAAGLSIRHRSQGYLYHGTATRNQSCVRLIWDRSAPMARRFDRIGWAYAQTQTSMPQRFVLVILADAAAEHDGTCFLSYTTIAERTGMGVTTVRDAIRALVEMELISSTPRYMKNGKQTSNIYRLGCYDEEGELGVSAADTQPGADTSPVGSRQHVDPPTRTTSRKTETTTSSRSSRRAARARGRDDGEWTDPAAAVFATDEPEEDEEAPATTRRRGGPDTAWSLNGYYRDKVMVAGQGRIGNTNDGALRKFFAAARKAGVDAVTLRTMVDVFVDDDQLFNRARDARWKVFIANAPLLQGRAANLTQQSSIDIESNIPASVRAQIADMSVEEIMRTAG